MGDESAHASVRLAAVADGMNGSALPGQPESSGNNAAVQEVVLGLLTGRGYVVVATPPDRQGHDSTLAVLGAQDHRALVRFLWGPEGEIWGPSTIEDFGVQMRDLHATRGYMVTNSAFSEEAVTRADETGIALMDGQTLNNTVIAAMPPTWRPARTVEEPLPFARYIPWFVGISLILIVAIVLILTSIELTSLNPV